MIGRLVEDQEPVLLSMVMGLAEVPMSPVMLRVMESLVRVPVPVRVPVAVRLREVTVMSFVEKPMSASVPEALSMRVAEEKSISEEIIISPAVCSAKNPPVKPAGITLTRPVLSLLR